MGGYSNHSPVRSPFSQTVSFVQAQWTLQVHQGTYVAFTETISRTLLVREVFDNSGFPQIPRRNNEASAQSCVHSLLQKAPVCHKTDKVRFHKFTYVRHK